MGITHYSFMVFPQVDGTFTMNITIATGYGQSWTSPERPVEGTTIDEARANGRAITLSLIHACESPGS